ncbi:hypothetical protein LTR47_002881 [Exophiala xenobiotica]|nr:hypothetical protein LTR41_004625 [Exophiala xenobiotica]KAK5225867.1 hypothetical protein LTR72_003770 [Exophiala xenobiotica]KAK5236155.1 hypothetical protein LTR47_002881 [Exophiala xenobiotica]KAK5255149.1 hypothetical protein LTS06_000562 [Exophiala xenobiotica]KAK5298687.1 hypothetical protein LTR14_002538 [Exophiala xenobiotica]
MALLYYQIMATDNYDVVDLSGPATPNAQTNSPTFLGLPKEVRLQILTYTLNPNEGKGKICDVGNCGRTRLQTVYDEPDGTKCPKFNTKTCPAILLVNRQIYEEGREILWKTTKFWFCSRICLRLFSQSIHKDHAKLVDEIICGKTTDTLLTMPFVMIRHNQQRVDEYMMNLVLSSKEVGANLSVFLDDVQDMLDTVYLDGNTTWSKCLVENIQGHPNYGYLGNKPVRLVLKKEAAAGGGIKYINGGVAVTTLPDPPALDLLWAKLCFWLSIPVRDRQPLAVFSRQCDQLFDYETGESSLVPRRPGLFVID